MKFEISDVFSKRFSVISLAYYIIACLAVMFIPYAFPPEKVSHSYSYMVGFDNRIAFLLLFLCAIIPFFAGFKSNESIYLWNPDLKRLDVDKSDNRFVVYTVIISSIVLAIIGIGYGLDEFYGFFEGEYFYHFLFALDFDHSLYTDVQFIYGPLSIYPVWLLTKLGLEITFSYYFVLIIYQTIGLFFAYDVLASMQLGKNERRILFILIALISFPSATGFNYCLIRFALLPWLFLNLVSKYNSRSKLLNIVLSPVYFLISLFYSPEIGLCFLVISCAWLFFKTIFDRRWNFILSIILIISSFIAVLFIYPEYLSSVFQAGSGGANFPYVPSLIIVLTVFVFIVYGFLIGKQAQYLKGNIDLIALETAMIIASPAGLGRCDPVHVLNFCMFAIIIAYVVSKQFINKKLINLFFAATVFTFFPFQMFCIHKDIIEKITLNISIQPEKDAVVAQRHADMDALLGNLSGAVTSVQCGNDIYLYLNQHYDYKETFFGYTPQWIGTKDGFDRELSELKSINPKYIVVPVDYKTKWMDRKYMGISQLLYFSYYPVKPKRYYNEVLYGDLIDYLSNDFSVVNSNEIYAVLKNNDYE